MAVALASSVKRRRSDDAERVDARGAVERRGDRRPPVDDDRVVVVVLDVAPADVPVLAARRPATGSPVSMRPKKSPAPGEREVLQRLLRPSSRRTRR